jgi:hypothetical protein
VGEGGTVVAVGGAGVAVGLGGRVSVLSVSDTGAGIGVHATEMKKSASTTRLPINFKFIKRSSILYAMSFVDLVG